MSSPRDRAPAGVVLAAAALSLCACMPPGSRKLLAEADSIAASAREAPRDSEKREKPATPASLAATEQALAAPLDRATLEALVLARHPSLRAADHRVQAMAEDARAAASLPSPEAMAQLWMVPLSRPYALDDAGMLMLSVRQQIPAPGTLEATSEAASHEARAQASMALGRARELVRDVDMAFADYAQATSARATLIEHRGVVTQMAELTRARYAARAPLADVTRAELEGARLDAGIAKELGAVAATRSRLNGLLVRSPSAPLGEPAPTPAESVAPEVEPVVARALSRHPELAAAASTERAAESAERAASREGSYPSFQVALDYFHPVGGEPAGYGAEVGMSLPWLWGGSSSRTRGAAQRTLAERAEVDTTRARIEASIGTSHAAVLASERRFVVLRDAVAPAAKLAVEAAQTGYATGGGDLLGWLDAVRSSLEAASDLAEARGDLDRALADLDWAAGERVPRVAVPSTGDTSHGR